MIELGAQEGRWRPLVIKTTWGRTTAREKLVRRSETELAETLRRRLTDRLMAELRKDANSLGYLRELQRRRLTLTQPRNLWSWSTLERGGD